MSPTAHSAPPATAADRALADAQDTCTLIRMHAGLAKPDVTPRARELMLWRIASVQQRMAERQARADREAPCERYAREQAQQRLGLGPYATPMHGVDVSEISMQSWFAELAAR